MAQERLTAAFKLQRQLGDVAGLARSTAALADLCMRTGQLDQAVALLADSITLNVDKGSPIGLAFNRHTLGALTRAAAQAQGPDAHAAPRMPWRTLRAVSLRLSPSSGGSTTGSGRR